MHPDIWAGAAVGHEAFGTLDSRDDLGLYVGTGCWPRNEDGNLTGFLSKHGRCRHTVAGPVAEDDDIAGVADGVTAPPMIDGRGTGSRRRWRRG